MPSAIRNLLARLVLLVPLLLGGAAVARAQDSTALGDSSQPRIVGVLHAGDILRIRVYRDSELSGEYLIDSRGTLQIPGIGEVRAAGLDPLQVKSRLVEALRVRGFANPELAVQSLVRVSVLGEVRTPQLYKVEPGTSLIQLLTMAGGPTERADLRRVRVVRNGRAFVVNMEGALAGSASGLVVLNSNDVLYVPRRTGLTREVLGVVLSTVTLGLTVANLFVSSRR